MARNALPAVTGRQRFCFRFAVCKRDHAKDAHRWFCSSPVLRKPSARCLSSSEASASSLSDLLSRRRYSAAKSLCLEQTVDERNGARHELIGHGAFVGGLFSMFFIRVNHFTVSVDTFQPLKRFAAPISRFDAGKIGRSTQSFFLFRLSKLSV